MFLFELPFYNKTENLLFLTLSLISTMLTRKLLAFASPHGLLMLTVSSSPGLSIMALSSTGRGFSEMLHDETTFSKLLNSFATFAP